MGTKNRLCGWLAALLISVASLALAHDPGLSTATVKLLPGRLAAEATFARADIEALIPLDVNHDGKVSSQEWQQCSTDPRTAAAGYARCPRERRHHHRHDGNRLSA